jgi:hypothetical protein
VGDVGDVPVLFFARTRRRRRLLVVMEGAGAGGGCHKNRFTAEAGCWEPGFFIYTPLVLVVVITA